MAEAHDYYYETEIVWQVEKHGQIDSAGLAPITTGTPPEFNGRAGDWSPEHLLVASLNSCYMLTFLAIAEFSKIAIVSFSSSAKGKLAKVEGSTYQITEIVVKPIVVIASANDLSRMPRILEKAKENCFVSNSIKATITIEPQVFHHQAQTSPCPLGEAPSDLTAMIEQEKR